jgi:hypothetical protein
MTKAFTLIRDVDVVRQLQTLQPTRAMSWTESHSIAERQAALLLELLKVDEPPVPQFVITSLPGLMVDWQQDWPSDATSFHTGRYWQIVVRAGDCRQRQRFSLAHEFKHVLDDPAIHSLYRHLPDDRRQGRIEAVCNYFAACLLMPRPWIKHDYYGGLQSVRALARRYYVSVEAMTTRLSELGLTPMTLAIEPTTRRHSEAA